MTGEHERYEQLAVGHVLGGLDAADAAEFRSHLLGCRDCRLRVAELRDIAADLAAAERDERVQAQVRTEVARQVVGDGEELAAPPAHRIGVRHVTVAAVVVVVFAAAMAFWNLHLRTASNTYASVAEYRGDTLRELATGVPVPAELADGVQGLIVVDGDQVAFTLDGLRSLADEERLVVWLTGTEDGEDIPALRIPARQLGAGVLAGHLDDRGASEVVVTLQRGARTEEPSGEVVARADLQAARSSSGAG
jgi:anti-sigma-K factor RskA